VLAALALVAGAGFVFWRAEGDAPEVVVHGAPPGGARWAVGAAGLPLAVRAGDAGSGLRAVSVRLEHDGEAALLQEETFAGGLLTGGADPGATANIETHLDPRELELPEGDATLTITARDWSWRGGFGGNETVLEVPLRVDLTPPRVSVRSGLTYVREAGSGAVVYAPPDDAIAHGVQVGEAYFPGFSIGGGEAAAIFAVPDTAPGEAPRVVARDAAGNEGKGAWPVVVRERQFAEADVRLPASFLDTKVPPLAAEAGIDAEDPAEAFRVINTRVRAENEARIRKLLADTAPEPLWEGAFVQMQNSQVTSRFAERRRYLVGGTPNSEAIHYGYDLASTRAAPVPAANTGRVVHAGALGIYGNCVLVDHGMGVGSLYGHLSRIDVAVGDRVSKGDTLGLSGATGLAGGDHLHFAILVGDVYVDPIEWWDPKWVETHVSARLRPPSR